jgi:uncharacterized membrane protein
MENAASGIPVRPATERLLSIDVFRGPTILAMILANDLDMAGIRDVGWLNAYLNAGPVGIARSARAPGLIGVFLTAGLARWGVRLRL